MNKGKICISVCAETADELINQINRAEELADVIEIRFDCLQENELNNFLHKFNKKSYPKDFLATFRPKEQGGKKDLTFEQRKEFWLCSHIFELIYWGDLEEDFDIESIRKLWGQNAFEKIIKSQHDFTKVPQNLPEIYERLKESSPDIIKIAAQTHDITDAIPLWKLLEKAKSEKKEIIPIAMGESGKWTRILGLAHGAFMTYASLDAESETAPGQVSAKDLIEVYRAKELDANTDVYGIIGGNTSYSMSPYMHNAAFKFHRLNAVFVPLQIQNLEEFVRRTVREETREINLNFKGFAVTNPHKQNIIKHLDFVDETAEKIGAVNTVKIVGKKLCGYNTDAEGFIQPLLNFYGDLRGAKVAVCGAGGAARACVYALKQNGASVTIFARNHAKALNLAAEFQANSEEFSRLKNQRPDTKFDILVNTTPLGTKGEFENQSIATAEEIENLNLVYDLVYNPFQTGLLQEADLVCVPKIGGMAMLVAQAAAQQKIWTGLDAPIKEMSAEVLKRLQ